MGILIGEQSVPLARHILSDEQVNLGRFHRYCLLHIFGHPPSRTQTATVRVEDADSQDQKAG